MDRTTEYPVLARMELPRPGGARLLFVFSLLLLFFVGLACYYLVYYKTMPNYAVTGATLYLALVIAGVWFAALLQGGFRQYLMNKGATLASRHFVEISQDGDDQKITRFGFEIRNRRFDQLRIPTDRIVAVSWGAGQRSVSSGRDRKDWMVALWYHSAGARRWTGEGWSEEAAFMVRRRGSAEETVAFGEEFVQFLQDAGIELVASERESEFRVTGGDPDLPEK